MNPTTLAEQATLGALLLDPTQIPAVQGFLRPTDFLSPWHRGIFEAMLTRQSAGQPITAPDIHADLVAGTTRHYAPHADEGIRVVRLVSLMEVPPPRPKLLRYAQMVLEAALRRQVRDLGLLLRAGAVVATTDTAGPRAAHDGPFAEITAQLHEAADRWDTATVHPFDTPSAPRPEAIAQAAAHRDDVAGSAARLVDAAPAVHAAQIHLAELDVLAGMLAYPSSVPAVRARISGSLFRVDTHRNTFAAICDLADLDEPIDAVTVAWQAQREQALRGNGLAADTVLQLSTHPPAGDPAHAAEMMAQLATRTVADQSAQALAIAAGHPGITVPDLLDTAHSHLAAVQRAVTGPKTPRPGSWARPWHLQLVRGAQAVGQTGRSR